ncbi:ribosome biogenesis GTPase YqeH [Ammoniphilus oxalaticus]|uniref:Ribosome biogenesis GTPase YqeH n=1 Tax=Ammoniphilus oxalaticus TaxID=66863 RepID=A0A419SKZ8_9BACL|nr:ribosome biogenesis GTPase YqeH [Ammoniphilus oxalaticus]RKD24665.1 ribosome biogenesis GTPase YqeH [Ammoniphilus oxalaticus]
MIETKSCAGCGVTLQTENQRLPGFIPNSAIDKEQVICQRCFRIKHYNEVAQVSMDDDDFVQILNGIASTDSLVVKVVDIFDFNGSWLSGLHRFVGNNPILLVGNKLDLLPQAINPNRLVNWMRYEAKQLGLKPVDVMLCSAKQGRGLDQLVEAIVRYRRQEDIYIVGATNVGKSTLINTLLRHYGENELELTTSRFPGTTLDMIEIPIDERHSLFDTPGIINKDQIVHMVDPEDLKLISPETRINPKVFQLNDQQTLFLGGMARVDFVSGKRQPFVVYVSNRMHIHRTKLEKADELFETHAGSKILSPPHGENHKKLPPLQRRTFRIRPGEKKDIVISGLGWITVGEVGASVDVHAPRGVSVILRNALI